jgi:hypothetical protein
MMPSTASQPSFDLLELAWWQNPWYYLLGAAVVVTLVALCAVWYFWMRRPQTAEEILLETLKAVSELPATTQVQQKKIYALITEALKIYCGTLTNTDARLMKSLTDDELVQFIYVRQVDESLIRAIEPVMRAGSQVKFACAAFEQGELENALITLKTIITHYHEKNTSSRTR